MTHILENDYLRIEIDQRGAQVMSIFDKTNSTEYLWQGDPTYWGDRAPLLFPICGRLTNGQYTYQGKTYEMTIHGFVRRADGIVSNKTDSSISFTFCDDEQTRAQYPFSFHFTVTYTLTDRTVDHHFVVENTGDELLPFSLGGHPGFNVPLEQGTDFSDYYIEFSEKTAPRRWCLTDTGYMLGKSEPFALENGTVCRLDHSLFDHDAIFLLDIAPSVTLKSDKTTKGVTVSYTNMPYLGLWHKPKTTAPYICIEPWNGMPADADVVDDMATKKYMNRIEPGTSAEFGIALTIHA